ncbi:hydroxyacid dehydrogenase [Brevibacillus humidisoli]|uniref:hydroxyacid dehydrogenase n=1 Tax=Brevibacillus humidisoli TaxID=2895522 RepID=UPI001E47E602|nr:hydroxyacid dehydrogenase [Brevibacillus humidisoli]UFJ38926.1 hydroxyacid dehydrogenase [Brevibacillus humidisoli]
MNVLITELIWPIGIEKLEEAAVVDYDPTLWADRELLQQRIGQADALIVRNQTKVDAELLRSAGQLKAIGRLGVGLDNIDLSAAKQYRVPVVYARNANAIAVAEYVLAAMLETSRALHQAHHDVRQGNWDRRRHTGVELYGKTIGLIGMGEIAHRVAKRAASFGMNMLGFDPFVAAYDFAPAETGIAPVSLSQLLSHSDFISVHIPLTAQTKSLLSTRQFQHMKPHAYLINTSRGGIVDESALLQAVQHGTIAGAFLDVLEQEPIDPANPLLHCEKVVITPHVAGLTEESQVRTSLLVAEEIIKILRGEFSLCAIT